MSLDEQVDVRELPENYRPATDDTVPEGRACGNCRFFNEDDVAPDGRARCTVWDEYVDGGSYCDSWEPREEQDGSEVDDVIVDDERATDLEREVRTAHGTIEVREGSDGMTFEGYAAVFNSPSEPLPFVERIAPGAFSRSLKSRNDVKMLWNHDTSQVLGSTRAKTLTLVEDERGLKVSGVLPNTSAGRDAAELLRRGDVDGMSFGFTVIRDAWNSEGSERTLKAVRLHEVSITPYPAYGATAGTTSVRNLDKLAERAAVPVDELSAALMKVEAGEDITPDDRTLLTKVIDQLAPQPETVEPELDMLALKKKKLNLLKGV
jgi:HK97 family phage prohead protease